MLSFSPALNECRRISINSGDCFSGISFQFPFCLLLNTILLNKLLQSQTFSIHFIVKTIYSSQLIS